MTTSHREPVRPRWVWAGTVVAVVGFMLLGVAAAIGSWWWALAGAIVLAIGLVAARHGRILRDVHGSDPSGSAGETEARQLRAGETHRGVRAGDMLRSSEVRRDAARTEEVRRSYVQTPSPRGHLAGAEAMALLAAAAVLIGAQLALYPGTATGEGHATAMLLPAIVLALCGTRIFTDPDEPHRLAALLALAAGAGTVLFAVLVHHQATGTWVLELVCGATATLASVGALVDRTGP